MGRCGVQLQRGPRDENINWMYDLDERQKRVSVLVYLVLEMLAYVGAPLKQAWALIGWLFPVVQP